MITSPFLLVFATFFACLPQHASPLQVSSFPPPQKAPPTSPLSDFFIGTNSAFRALTVRPVRDFLERELSAELSPSSESLASAEPLASSEPLAPPSPAPPAPAPPSSFLEKVSSPPRLPMISRPAWLTIAASVPTGLAWYGFYKFSVEEELFQMELREKGSVSGAGGYGTLLPFVFAFLLGALSAPVSGGVSEFSFGAGALWILAGQVNLYRRVNELFEEKGEEAPLHAWWALLPPPLDVVVGLRQVHFLARFAAAESGETWQKDPVAEELFPFISSERFTLREFALQPKRWFAITKDAKDIDVNEIKAALDKMLK